MTRNWNPPTYGIKGYAIMRGSLPHISEKEDTLIMHAVAYVVAIACVAAAVLVAIFGLGDLLRKRAGMEMAFWLLLVAAVAATAVAVG